jgi:CTP:molybdopterin cytidylyltransferase MocA
VRCQSGGYPYKRAGMIAGLVLAAGEGARFGSEPKQLAEFRGRPLLEHAIAAQCHVAELERVVVVLGACAERITAAVDFMRAEPVVCERWREGQSASLRFGLEALRGADRVLVTLGDQPLITPEVVARLTGEPPGTRAVYNGRPGHPVVLGAEQIEALLSLTGDRGARELLRGGAEVELGGLGDLSRDIDTPEDLERLRNEARAVV